MIEQNLFLAIALALLGGLFQVLSVLILAYPKARDYEVSKLTQKALIPMNIFVQLLNGAATSGAAIFGPVAIVMPVTVSAQLLFNIIIFGYLEMEAFDKDVQVGTFIVVSGAILLPFVGPTIQNDQEIMELLSSPWALAWTSFLSTGVLISGILCFTTIHTKKWKERSKAVYVNLTIARVFSSVLSASLSKALALVTGPALVFVVLGFLLCGFVLGTSVVLQATKVEQKLFVPVISSTTQIVNAATGLILWEDWLVVQSWAGYAVVMMQIIVGVYLISSLDFFENTADPHYGMRQSMAITSVAGRRHAFQNSKHEGKRDLKTNLEESFRDNKGVMSSQSIRSGLIGGQIDSSRGLIGGFHQFKNGSTESSLDAEDDNNSKSQGKLSDTESLGSKTFLKAIELAVDAAERGENRHITPPKHKLRKILNDDGMDSSIESFPDNSNN